MAAELTLGAEEELHLIDTTTWQLSARAPQLLSRLPEDSYSAEIQRTTVETNTAVTQTLDGLRDELVRLRRGVQQVADAEGLAIAAVGTAPRSEFSDFELTATGRYGRMQEQYRMLVDEQLICGLQIHVGVSDRDLAVEIMQRIGRDLPILLALSASSPYWNGSDTGYASIRSIIWQRWPSAGATGPLHSADEYDALLADMINTGVIADAKMAYFDVRPSAHAPTLELRVCDACPIVDDAVLIAGLFRAAVHRAEDDIRAGRSYHPVAVPIHRAAIWRAARNGLASELLDHTTHPQPMLAGQAVLGMLDRLRPQLEELGDWEQVSQLAHDILARGNSADRQRAAYAERGDLADVVRLVVQETQGASGGPPPTTPALRRYRSRAGVEAVWLGARPRPAYADIISFYRGASEADRVTWESTRDRWTLEAGMTFGVEQRQQPFAVDLVPRVINAYEWRTLAEGLIQRARALELFLRDVYGPQRVVADGIVPDSRVTGSPGWRPEGRRLPDGTVRGPVMGFDLVRNEFGGWRVLEDNLRNPSGAAYAIAVRDLMDAVVPGLPRPDGLRDPATALPELRRAVLGGTVTGATAGLLSSGPSSSAWFEHRLLAERGHLLLLTADDLLVVDGEVRHRSSGRRIDALYLRLDVELVDLVAHDGSPIGAEVFEVAAAGDLLLANAPGNGVADDKNLYCYVPELIGYYLDERPLLESVPTYRTSDPVECHTVLERVGELVTKPVDGHGGLGVLIGPDASAAQVSARRAEIAADPAAWVAQEVVALSSHPTFGGPLLTPRHVDLRAFVYLTGTEPDQIQLADLALTRVAPEGSLVVNSSRGGGAKDTWIIGEPS